ncbi:hypothetical protein FRB95_010259 [Tulasnella sp. JGI-2019a]|nr:hypothetical protein FRB95_010259 [Tulasnella sp. JGI-2019a]
MSQPVPKGAEDLHKVLKCGSPCTAVAFSPRSDPPFLLVGSEDGALRCYASPFDRVHRAVKALGEEISCVAFDCSKDDTSSDRSCWIACGTEVLKFDLYHAGKLILSRMDVKTVTRVLQGRGEDDVLNEIAVYGPQMAFTSDAGVVGVHGTKSGLKTLMKTKHSRICSSVKFVPNTSGREIVSAGYDCTLLHHDTTTGTTHSRRDIPPALASAESVSMCPPFILSVSMSEMGTIATSTADGRVWIGKAPFVGPNGGKPTPGKQIKWKGLSKLDNQSQREFTIAQGPVTAIEIVSIGGIEFLFTLSLSGRLQVHRIPSLATPPGDDNEERAALPSIWERSTKSVIKTNGLACSPATRVEGVNGRWIAIGGVGAGSKGFVEMWFLPASILRDGVDV